MNNYETNAEEFVMSNYKPARTPFRKEDKNVILLLMEKGVKDENIEEVLHD
jgi:hypothetical protein